MFMIMLILRKNISASAVITVGHSGVVFSEVHSMCSVAFFIPFANWHCFGGEEVKRDVCSHE